MASVWDDTITEKLNGGASVVDTLFNCIQNYNKDCALRHPSCFEGKDIAADLRETLSWCVANVQSFGKQVKEYPIKSRVYDMFGMIALLIRDYEKQIAQDGPLYKRVWDRTDKGILRDMTKVYQYGDEIFSESDYELPQIDGVTFRPIKPRKPSQKPTSPLHVTTNLIALAKECPGLQVTITLGDLLEANKLLIAETKRELEQEITDANIETYPNRKKVMEMLGVSEATLRRWAKVGYLTPINAGGRRRYRMSDVKRILEGEK